MCYRLAQSIHDRLKQILNEHLMNNNLYSYTHIFILLLEKFSSSPVAVRLFLWVFSRREWMKNSTSIFGGRCRCCCCTLYNFKCKIHVCKTYITKRISCYWKTFHQVQFFDPFSLFFSPTFLLPKELFNHFFLITAKAHRENLHEISEWL